MLKMTSLLVSGKLNFKTFCKKLPAHKYILQLISNTILITKGECTYLLIKMNNIVESMMNIIMAKVTKSHWKSFPSPLKATVLLQVL